VQNADANAKSGRSKAYIPEIYVKRKKHTERTRTKAEVKQLADEWQKMLKKHATPLERGAKSKGAKTSAPPKQRALLSLPHVTGDERTSSLQRAKSKGTGVGNATKKKDQVYTGTEMLGVGQLHKSNSVPVFRQEDAVDIAKMRR
jgi:hypothetical protein